MAVRVKDHLMASGVLCAVFAQQRKHFADAFIAAVAPGVQVDLPHVEGLAPAVDIPPAAVVEPHLRLGLRNIGHALPRRGALREQARVVIKTAILRRQPECLEHPRGHGHGFNVLAVYRLKNAGLQNHLGVRRVDLFRRGAHFLKMRLLLPVALPDPGGAAEEFDAGFQYHANVVVQRVAHGDPLRADGV